VARGAPDDSNIVTQNAVYRLDDLAELAARLGSPVVYNRYGSVILAEDFTSGLGTWALTGNAGAASAYLNNEYPLYGGVCVVVNSGDVADEWAGIGLYLAPPVLGKIGFLVPFTVVGSLADLQLFLRYYNGSIYVQFGVKYDLASNVIYYQDNNGAWVQFATGYSLFFGAGMYHTLKLLVDLVSNSYVGVYVNQDYHTLAAIVGYPVVSNHAPGLYLYIRGTSAGVENAPLYLDGIVVTQNEM